MKKKGFRRCHEKGDAKIRRQTALSATGAGLFDLHVIMSKLSLPAGLWIVHGGRGFDAPPCISCISNLKGLLLFQK
jgi:hypothetical protein